MPLSEAAWVGLCSFAGVLVRYYLTDACDDQFLSKSVSIDHTSELLRVWCYFQSYLPANIVGCFVIGIIVATKEICDRNIHPIVYAGFTTGFCGCLTTFSTALLDFAGDSFDRNWFYSLLSLVFVFQIFYCFFIGGIAVVHIIVELQTMLLHNEKSDAANDNAPERVPSIEAHGVTSLEEEEEAAGSENGKSREVIELPSPLEIDSKQDENNILATIFLTFEWVVLVLFLSIWIVLWNLVTIDIHYSSFDLGKKNRDLLRSLALTPFGVGVRYALNICQSRYVSQFPWLEVFPLSTFTCNMIAVFIGAFLMVYAGSWSWLAPFTTGMLGSLSTVSSFMAELHVLGHSPLTEIKKFRMIYAARYMLVTILLAVMISQLIFLGSSSS